MNKHATVYLLVAVASLAAIGYGSYVIYPPTALIAVGLLCWIDLSLGRKRQ